MQAILITSSLLLVAGMLGSLAWLSLFGVRPEADAVAVEPTDEL